MGSETGLGEQKDLKFANLAIKKGYITPATLREILSKQTDLATKGQPARLSTVMIQSSAMTASQVREIMTEVEKNSIECAGCGSSFNIEGFQPGKKFICKKCKAVVVVPGLPDTPSPAKTASNDVALTIAEAREPAGSEQSSGLSPAQETAGLVGRVVGGCRIERLLGAGGMGAVYLAIQVSLGRPVALKLLPKSLSANTEYITRFEREARAVALLNHPNIVQVHDMGRDPDGFYFIVMEFVDGSTFGSHIKEKGALDEKMAVKALRQACSGLHAAHEAGIIHRDIKPENVMISRDGRVKITDFGLAKETKGDSQLTGTGIALGTPAYMAPEQGMGETPDRRSDIYAIGATLFTLVTGRLPYDAKSPLSMMMKHATDPVPMARESNPAVSEVTEQVICKAMAKKPDDRFQTMAEMRDALTAALSASGSAVEKPPAANRPDFERQPTPVTPPKSIPKAAAVEPQPTPVKRGRTPLKEKKLEPEDVQKRGQRQQQRPAPAAEDEKTAPGRRGARRSPQQARGERAPGGKGSGMLFVAMAAAAVVLIVIVIVVVVASSGGRKSNGDAEGSGGQDQSSKQDGNQASGKTDDSGSQSTGTGKGTDPGTGKGTGPGPEKPPDGTGVQKPPAADEPEGPSEPPALPSGVTKGDNPGEYVNSKDGSVLVWIPAGRVELGLSTDDFEWVKGWFKFAPYYRYEMSMPRRSVYVDGYFICKYEITNAQYERFLEWCRQNPTERDNLKHPSAEQGNSPMPGFYKKPGFSDMDAPVVGIDWYDAFAYAKWAGMDLPTEAQWEKAANWDPSARKRRRFPWGDTVEIQSAHCADSIKGKAFDAPGDVTLWYWGLEDQVAAGAVPVPVDRTKRDVSAFGVVGMAGNVAEWCRDMYHVSFLQDPDSAARNVYDNAYHKGRVVRGSSFAHSLEYSLTRQGYYATEKNFAAFIGFRCAVHTAALAADVPPEGDEAALRALPEQVMKRTVLGRIEDLRRDDNPDAVKMRAQWATRQFPQESEFFSAMGSQLLKDREVHNAMLMFKDAIDLETSKSRKARIMVKYALALRRAGDKRMAQEMLEKAIELNPFDFEAIYQRASFKLDDKEYKAAIEDFSKAAMYDYNCEDALHNIGTCHKRLRNYPDALRYFQIVLKMFPRDTAFLYDRGEVLFLMKKYEEAKEDFQKALDLKDALHGYLGLAKYHQLKGDIDTAIRFADMGLASKGSCAAHREELEDLRKALLREKEK